MRELGLFSPKPLEFVRIGQETAVGESEVAGCSPRISAGTCEEGVCAVGMGHECTHQPTQGKCWSFTGCSQTCTAI